MDTHRENDYNRPFDRIPDLGNANVGTLRSYMRFKEVAFIGQLPFFRERKEIIMKKYNILRLSVMAMLIAVGVVISPILRIEGMCPMGPAWIF